MNKKFRKLLRNPKLFFRDMYEKRKHQLSKIPPITKVNGSNQYTVVSAIYNAEKYLDDLFKSITSQTYAFKKHIHIVCVDDGSTDSSEQIIKNWQKRYPNNITYIYKENGGLRFRSQCRSIPS